MVFRLFDGDRQASVDQWQQELNPDGYAGNDYVSSFCLIMSPQPDGSVSVAAPAPGRYKIRAQLGGSWIAAYVLVRPASPALAVRGLALLGNGPLDRKIAATHLQLASKLGINWIQLGQLGWIDLDAGKQEIDPYCSVCPVNAMPLGDLEWLVGEVHRAGLSVVLAPEVQVRKGGAMYDVGGVPRSWLPDPSALMDSYSRFALTFAALAQRSSAEALYVGGTEMPLWGADLQNSWVLLFRDIRAQYSGAVWAGPMQTCPGLRAGFPFLSQVNPDAIVALSFKARATADWCRESDPGATTDTASVMASSLTARLPASLPTQRQHETGKPIRWVEFLAINVDGVANAEDFAQVQPDGTFQNRDLRTATRDDQEIVDYFEALMQALSSQQPSSGFFLWADHLTAEAWGVSENPLRQTPLWNAVANWWAGTLSPCSPLQAAPVLAQDDFEPGACPLGDSALATSDGTWSIRLDDRAPGNHVLRGTTPSGPWIPYGGASAWKDYAVRLRLRSPGAAATISVRVNNDRSGPWFRPAWRVYDVSVLPGEIRLVKHLNDLAIHQTLASQPLASAAATNDWHHVEIRVVANTISVAFEGRTVITYTDTSDPLLSGGVALGVAPGQGQPVVDFDDIQIAPIGSILAAAACDSSAQPTSTAYLPNVTKTLGGPSGFGTPFIVQNVGATATDLEVSYYRFSDGSLVTCRKITGVAPATSFADVPNNDGDLPGNTQFSVVVRSFGAQVVAIVNEHTGSGDRAEALSYDGFAAGAGTVFLPNVVRRFFGYHTPFVIQNLGTATTVATATFVGRGSEPPATITRTIAAGRSQFIEPNVEAGLVDGGAYAVTVRADQALAVVVNTHNDDPSVAHPAAHATDGIASGSGSMYGAYAAKNANDYGRAGTTSTIVVQNVGPGATTPTLEFTPLGGGSATTFAGPAIAAGGAWAFDPRFMNGVSSSPICGANASVGCLADGEFTFKASAAGLIAATVSVISPDSAMGYTATGSPATKYFLPNVTRTLGGPMGWTTPILLLSVNATAATLEWRRFTDGALVTTQNLTLTPGSGIRIDPLAVGVSDNTQYAVTVTGIGGQVATIVEELASGGDNAMMYEGFGQ